MSETTFYPTADGGVAVTRPDEREPEGHYLTMTLANWIMEDRSRAPLVADALTATTRRVRPSLVAEQLVDDYMRDGEEYRLANADADDVRRAGESELERIRKARVLRDDVAEQRELPG